MSRDKQIEEIEEVLRVSDSCKHLPRELCNKTSCSRCEAELLYDEGLRKIVLCRDCVWWEARGGSYMGIGKCQNPTNGLFSEYTDDTDFCSYAKMKGGAE